MTASLALRARCFGAAGGIEDAFDDSAQHVMVQAQDSNELLATFRMSVLSGALLDQSYAAQYYDLSRLAAFDGPMLELGRFCIAPDHPDPDILRIAWAALTSYVNSTGVRLLFGCSSFAGTDTAAYLDAFALLKARHLAPANWAPDIRAPDVFNYAAQLDRAPDIKRANAAMPPLLRTYLMMGGWVSDHAVVDRAMGTLHVFTGLEIEAIPPARKRLLRALI
ncbi:MAG: GNAT family N-acyltransferase [Sulfitobacter sp.]